MRINGDAAGNREISLGKSKRLGIDRDCRWSNSEDLLLWARGYCSPTNDRPFRLDRSAIPGVWGELTVGFETNSNLKIFRSAQNRRQTLGNRAHRGLLRGLRNNANRI